MKEKPSIATRIMGIMLVTLLNVLVTLLNVSHTP